MGIKQEEVLEAAGRLFLFGLRDERPGANHADADKDGVEVAGAEAAQHFGAGDGRTLPLETQGRVKGHVDAGAGDGFFLAGEEKLVAPDAVGVAQALGGLEGVAGEGGKRLPQDLAGGLHVPALHGQGEPCGHGGLFRRGIWLCHSGGPLGGKIRGNKEKAERNSASACGIGIRLSGGCRGRASGAGRADRKNRVLHVGDEVKDFVGKMCSKGQKAAPVRGGAAFWVLNYLAFSIAAAITWSMS